MHVHHSLTAAEVAGRPAPVSALRDIYRPIEPELRAVRKRVQDTWAEALRLVHGPDLPIADAGGKLLRPALCLLSAGAIGIEDRQPLARMAAALELLHMAALVHDDVIDSALVRRGNSSLKAMWDDRAAVLGGDYLVSLAIQEIAGYGSCPLVSEAIDCIRHMAEGELTIFGRGYAEFGIEDSLNLIRQKTAMLFGVACSGVALLHDSPRFHQPLKSYGQALGTAFQLVDDLLDLSQNEATLGKPACGDVVEGKRTVPIIFMLERLDADGRRRLHGMKGVSLSEADRQWLGAALEDTGARDRTIRLAETYASKAHAALAQLPPSICRESMAEITEFVLVRSA